MCSRVLRLISPAISGVGLARYAGSCSISASVIESAMASARGVNAAHALRIFSWSESVTAPRAAERVEVR